MVSPRPYDWPYKLPTIGCLCSSPCPLHPPMHLYPAGMLDRCNELMDKACVFSPKQNFALQPRLSLAGQSRMPRVTTRMLGTMKGDWGGQGEAVAAVGRAHYWSDGAESANSRRYKALASQKVSWPALFMAPKRETHSLWILNLLRLQLTGALETGPSQRMGTLAVWGG